MEGRSGFRTGLLVGVLAAAVLALGALVVALLVGGDDDETTTVTATAPATEPTASEPAVTEPSGSLEPVTCPDVPDIGPTGADPADAVNVTIVAMDCELATSVIADFYPTVVGTGADPAQGVDVQGFLCTETQNAGAIHVSCVQNVGTIDFDLG
jgi:hypothetical protein